MIFKLHSPSSPVCSAYGRRTLSVTPPAIRPPRVKAQVLYLSYDAPNEAGGGLAPPSSSGQWLPVMKEAVFVALRCVKVGLGIESL